MTKQQIKAVMSHLGGIRSEKKARAARLNGRMGGAPKKIKNNFSDKKAVKAGDSARGE